MSRSSDAPLWVKLQPDWRTLVSAVLLVLAFAPWNLHFLAWIALVPLLLALERAPSAKAAAIQGLWMGFLISLGGFYWVTTVLHQFADLPWAAAIFACLFFALVNQLQYPAFAFLRKWYLARFKAPAPPVLLQISFASFYAGLDWLTPKLFVDTLGHSQYNAPWIRQIADIGGPHIITFVIFFVNESLQDAWSRLRRRGEPSFWPALRACAPGLAVCVAIMGATLTYGAWRTNQIRNLLAQSQRKARFGVIQANIGDFDKVAAEQGLRGASRKVLNTYYELSDRALTMEPRPDVLIWPETSYPSTFRSPQSPAELENDQGVENYVRSRQVPLLFGGYDRDLKHDFNAFFYLSPYIDGGSDGRSDMQVYRKNILLRFGEYIPFAEYSETLRTAFPTVGNFGRGPGPTVIDVPQSVEKPKNPAGPLRSNPIICYEALFPNYVLDAARKGSELIINITNDSWFGPVGEPFLHLSLVIFRSIEARLPQLRATNTGISTLIQPDGEITQPSRVFEPEILNVEVKAIPPVWTLMKAWGDWFGIAAFFLGIAGLLGVYFRTEKGELP